MAQGQRQQAAAGRVLQVVGEGAEAIDVDEAVHHPPTVAQLAQGTDAQAAERQHAARPQDPPRLGQDRREVGAPLDGQAGEQQVATAVAQRQPLGVAADEMAGAAARSGMPQHAFGDIHGQALGRTEASFQGPAEITGAAAEIDPAARREAFRQCRQQALTDAALEFGHCVSWPPRGKTTRRPGACRAARQRHGAPAAARNRQASSPSRRNLRIAPATSSGHSSGRP